MTRRIASVLALTILALTAGFVGATLGHDPETVLELSDGSGGTVVERAPGETLPAIGPDGKPIVCDDGQVLQVDPLKDNPPRSIIETAPGGDHDPSTIEVTEGAMPRCGPDGGGADADPVWVPEHVARDHPQDAPLSFVDDQIP